MADLYSVNTFADDRTAPGQHLAGEAVVLSLVLDAARVAEATVEVIHPVTGSVYGPTAVAVPTTSATTTGAASKLSRTIACTGDLTDFEVGRQYLLDGPGFAPLMVTLTDINDGTGFSIDAQLRADLPTGSTLRDTTLAHSVGTLERARGYRAVWTLTPSSDAPTARTARMTTYFDVVYQPFQIPISQADVEAVLDGAAALMGSRWPALVRGATRAVVARLDSQGLDADRVRDPRPWITPAANWIAAALLRGRKIDVRSNDTQTAAAFDRAFLDSASAALSSPRGWYDWQDDDTKTADVDGKSLHFWSVGGRGRRQVVAERGT